jgi:hypothetical protein
MQTDKNHSTESAKSSWFALIPLLAGLGSVLIAIRGIGPPTLRWNGISLVQPVDSASIYEDQGAVLFETPQAESVRAAIGGTVSSVSERHLEIVQGQLVVRYRGLFSDKLHIGQTVKRGEVVGRLELDRPDPTVAKLWMLVLDNREPVIPPLKPRFPGEGQRIYAMSCAGCHQMRGIAAIEDGKLGSGRPLTDENVEYEIRNGGTFNKTNGLPPMPAFDKVLTETEIKAVTLFLCRDLCATTTGRPNEVRQ